MKWVVHALHRQKGPNSSPDSEIRTGSGFRSVARSSSSMRPARIPSRSGMSGKPDPAAFFEPQEDSTADHFHRHMFESNAGLHQFEPVVFTHPVHQGGRGQRLHHAPGLPAVHHEVTEEQANDLMGRQHPAIPEHSPDPVGVAIRDEAKIVRVLLQPCRRTRKISCTIGSGLTPPKSGLCSAFNVVTTHDVPPTTLQKIPHRHHAWRRGRTCSFDAAIKSKFTSFLQAA